MANHVPTNAAGGALRGGMLGAVLGFFAIPALVAGGTALLAAGGFLGAAAAATGTAIAGWAAGAALVTTVVNSFIPTPINNLAMAAYGAAGFGLFGAASGADRGIRENVQEQARSAYVNAYAQTRAGLDQMQQAAYLQQMGAVQAHENDNFPMAKASPQIDAATIEAMGRQQDAAVALEQGEGR